MVLNEIKENVPGNLGESTSFTIEANEAAFQILTDKLYKYRVRAIVRELAANAIDANRVLKTNLNNWEITLPNSINPTFAIEDFGIGMTDKEIKEVYTTFFKSTKSSSNDQTGMFGLGSKTPFAYTKQFIVESSKDGFKNIYSMHSENGKPEVIKVNPEPIPTNKTGTKVSFAVNNGDFREFYDAMIYSSAVWPGLPKINGASEFYSYLKNPCTIFSSASGSNTTTLFVSVLPVSILSLFLLKPSIKIFCFVFIYFSLFSSTLDSYSSFNLSNLLCFTSSGTWSSLAAAGVPSLGE